MTTTGLGRVATSLMLMVAAVAVAPAPARAEGRTAGSAIVGGRIVFRNGTREVSAQEVERLRWGHIAVELRRGWQVLTVRPDAGGVFAVVGPPGTYHFEYLRLGELAEFFPPHEVEAASGQITCIGTLEVSVADLARDLGQNTASTLRVRNDCADFGPSLRQLAAGGGAPAAPAPEQSAAGRTTGSGGGGSVTTVLARATPPEGYAPTVMDVLAGLRLEGDFTSEYVAAVRGNWVVPLTADKGAGNLVGNVSVAGIGSKFVNGRWPAALGQPEVTGTAWEGTAGVGYEVWAIELTAFGGYLNGFARGPGGPLVGGALRFGGLVFGIGGRVEQYFSHPGQVVTFTLDVSPFGLLGALL
jgi:hypothetical protein